MQQSHGGVGARARVIKCNQATGYSELPGPLAPHRRFYFSDPSCSSCSYAPRSGFSVRFLSCHHAEQREWARARARTHASRTSVARGNVYSVFHSMDGWTGALERAKLKGFQFDKALSANFSSEQLTGINSRFFFHRSPPLVPLSLLCPGAARSCERRRTRRANFSSFDRRARPFARLLIWFKIAELRTVSERTVFSLSLSCFLSHLFLEYKDTEFVHLKARNSG